jgi:hypothetical protein
MTLSQDAALGKNCAQNVPHGDGLVQDFHLFPRNINKIITLFYKKNKIFTVFSQKTPNLYIGIPMIPIGFAFYIYGTTGRIDENELRKIIQQKSDTITFHKERIT